MDDPCQNLGFFNPLSHCLNFWIYPQSHCFQNKSTFNAVFFDRGAVGVGSVGADEPTDFYLNETFWGLKFMHQGLRIYFVWNPRIKGIEFTKHGPFMSTPSFLSPYCFILWQDLCDNPQQIYNCFFIYLFTLWGSEFLYTKAPYHDMGEQALWPTCLTPRYIHTYLYL